MKGYVEGRSKNSRGTLVPTDLSNSWWVYENWDSLLSRNKSCILGLCIFFFLAVLSSLLHGPFSSWVKRGLLFTAVASLSVVMAHRLSCSVACGIFLNQGSNLCLLYRQILLPLSQLENPETSLYHLKVSLGRDGMHVCVAVKRSMLQPCCGLWMAVCSYWGGLMCWESFCSHCDDFINSVNMFLHVSMCIFTDATVWTAGVQRETWSLPFTDEDLGTWRWKNLLRVTQLISCRADIWPYWSMLTYMMTTEESAWSILTVSRVGKTLYLATLCGLRDLSSLSRDRTRAPL